MSPNSEIILWWQLSFKTDEFSGRCHISALLYAVHQNLHDSVFVNAPFFTEYTNDYHMLYKIFRFFYDQELNQSLFQFCFLFFLLEVWLHRNSKDHCLKISSTIIHFFFLYMLFDPKFIQLYKVVISSKCWNLKWKNWKTSYFTVKTNFPVQLVSMTMFCCHRQAYKLICFVFIFNQKWQRSVTFLSRVGLYKDK